MVELTEQAKHRLNQYLEQMRASLAGCKSLDPAEVEADVREHIERELQGADEPVPAGVLEDVLNKLGSPRQWVPEDELSPLHRIALRLRTGPEDWRLAYFSFGLLVLACLVLWFPPASILLILCSFLISRATISSIVDRRELGTQKWLVYPSLAMVYIILTILLFTWPLMATGDLHPHYRNYRANTTITLRESNGQMQYDREAHLKAKQAEAEGLEKYMAARTKWIFLMIGATTTWIMIAGFVAWRWPSLVRKGYRPFADDFTGKHGRIIFIAGIILTALTGASFFVVVS